MTYKKLFKPLWGGLSAMGLMLCFINPCFAQTLSPVGYWKTFSDKDNQPEAIVQIWEEAGELKGKLVKLFDSKDSICHACPGDKRNQPLIGLEIMWGAKRQGDEWLGGKILDPDSGDVYSLKLSLAQRGEQLYVRGFLGLALFLRPSSLIA